MTRVVRRKISSTGQVRLPTSFDIASEYLILEPGVYTHPNLMRMYPPGISMPFYGSMGGEILRAQVSPQNQVTIPSPFRTDDFTPGKTICVFDENSVIVLTPYGGDDIDINNVEIE